MIGSDRREANAIITLARLQSRRHLGCSVEKCSQSVAGSGPGLAMIIGREENRGENPQIMEYDNL